MFWSDRKKTRVDDIPYRVEHCTSWFCSMSRNRRIIEWWTGYNHTFLKEISTHWRGHWYQFAQCERGFTGKASIWSQQMGHSWLWYLICVPIKPNLPFYSVYFHICRILQTAKMKPKYPQFVSPDVTLMLEGIPCSMFFFITWRGWIRTGSGFILVFYPWYSCMRLYQNS